MNQDDSRKRGGRLFGTVSRRDFLQYCGGLAAAVAVPACAAGKKTTATAVAETIEKAARKPPVIWLHGQACTGCSISFLNAEEPDVATVILDTISLRYHESVMAASGGVAESALKAAQKDSGYVLVVEGSIPSADDRHCVVGGHNFKDTILETAKGAAAIIAIGACATYGGIPRGAPSKGMGVSHFVKDKPIINLPHCPVHHEQLLETIVYFLETKKVPELDKHLRPKMFFSKTVHERCPRLKHYEADEYLYDWNDPKTKDFCMAERGCKGPETYSDCVVRMYNGGVNHCLYCGSPCHGCAEPSFYEVDSPLFAQNASGREAKKEGLT